MNYFPRFQTTIVIVKIQLSNLHLFVLPFSEKCCCQTVDFILYMVVRARRWESARSECSFFLFLVPKRAMLLTMYVLRYILGAYRLPQRSFVTYTWYADELGSLPELVITMISSPV